MLSPEDQNLLTKPLRRSFEVAFHSILKNGDSYTFILNDEHFVTISRKYFSISQRSLFDSLAEFELRK